MSAKYGHLGLAGRADTKGFYLYGNVPTEDLRAAVSRAMAALGDRPDLAVHPRCGTNLVVTSLLGGLAAVATLATLSDDRDENPLLEVLPRMTLAAMAAAVAGQGLGPWVQERFTTCPDVGGAPVEGIERTQRGKHVFHRVLLTA